MLALHPWLFGPVIRLKPRERSWIVQDSTQFVIEGLPRSANTFAVMADMKKKFGTHFNVFEHTEENVKACFSQMSSFTFPLIAGVDTREA